MVLNDRTGIQHKISEQTRRRVWQAVEELGYVANPAARALAGGRSRVLGIYTFEAVFPVDFRDFYYPFLLGLEEEAERQDHDLLLFTSASGPDRHRTIYRDGVNRLRVADGCVLLGRGGPREELERLVGEPFPVVFVGRRELHTAPCAYVGADYVTATAEVVHHLADLGHRRIAYLSWGDQGEPTVDRWKGYEQGFQARRWQVNPTLVRAVEDQEVTTKLVDDLCGEGATAVICQDDVIAERVWAGACELDRRIPQDLSIAVLGDPPREPSEERDWTRFKIPRREMGEQALRALVGLLDAEATAELPQLVLPCALKVGATTGPAPA